MRFRRQLVVGHTALLFVTIVTGIVAVIALRTVTARLEHVTHDHAADMTALHRLRANAEQVITTTRTYAVTGDMVALERMDDVIAQVNASLAVLDRRRYDLGDEVAHVDEAARGYLAIAEYTARHRDQSQTEERARFFETALPPARDRFESAITRLVQREQDIFDKESMRERDFSERTELIVITTTGLALLLGVALAWGSIHRLGAQYARESEATSAARQASATRDELLAVVSHDLRNPLSTIAMGAALLDQLVPMEHRKYVAAISNASTRMQHLIDELLDVAKLEASGLVLNRDSCELRGLLDTVQGMFELRAREAGLELVIDAEELPAVLADRERVLQVLGNLIGNAFKYTTAGGRITLAARARAGFVELAVTDTGPGIPAEQQPHLFERYWQGRPRGDGSLGLGLYICKRLVDAHGGQIGVTSTPGSGSTFWFTLPATNVA